MLPEKNEDRYDYLVNLLKNNLVEITFTKVNGEERIMPCTLAADKLPSTTVKKTKERKRTNLSINVWCIDKNAWRSFLVANVTNINILAK